MGDYVIEMLWACAACHHRNLGRDLACGRCGKTKDNEEYFMPEDVQAAPVVHDQNLLGLAARGANRRCAYCGNDIREGSLECRVCGVGPDGHRVRPDAPIPMQAPPRKAKSKLPWVLGLGGAFFALSGITCVALSVREGNRRQEQFEQQQRFASLPQGVAVAAVPEFPRTVTAHVTGYNWKTTVTVERYQILDAEGFADTKPEGAMNVVALGDRVHHVDDVPDGFATETYSERVQDGFTTETYTEHVQTGTRSETYSERESCGQDCTTTPRNCSRKCTNSKNGFANCSDVCIGGDQKCTTRYCDRQKTRQVPAYGDVTKTRQVPKFKQVEKTRQVPKTKRVERFAPFFHWKAWSWKEDRVVTEQGTTDKALWPEDTKIALNKGVTEGQKEREVRKGTFEVTLEAEGHPLVLETTEEKLAAYAKGGHQSVKVDAGWRILREP